MKHNNGNTHGVGQYTSEAQREIADTFNLMHRNEQGELQHVQNQLVKKQRKGLVQIRKAMIKRRKKQRRMLEQSTAANHSKN